MIKDTAIACRSFRRFYEDERIPRELMVDMVDTTRYAAASCNAQVLKYKIFSTPKECAEMYPNVAWAGALTDWDGPIEGERPSGYIVIIRDEDLTINDKLSAWDEGIVAQTMMLAAREAGFGGCMIGSFKAGSVAKLCGLEDKNMKPGLILALGKPKEEVRIVDVPEDGNIKYFRDAEGIHYVPKRSLEDILL